MPATQTGGPHNGTMGEYQAHRDKMAARVRKQSRAGREIGRIAGIDHRMKKENRERRDSTYENLKLFCETYKAETFHLGWSPDHLRVIQKIETAILTGGLFAVAMPRGSGKTSLCEAAVEWALLHGHLRFPMILGANQDAATAIRDSILMDLETNELLAEDFPEVCLPIWSQEGIRQRRLLHNGKLIRMDLSGDRIILPYIEKSPSAGSVLQCAGLTSAFRGARVKTPSGETLRPDFFLADDPQTRESAKSPHQTYKRERILAGDVMGLAGPGKKIAGVVPLTVIVEGDMADRILDRNLHPEYSGERTKLINVLPTNTELWETYSELRADELRENQSFEKATEFYRANQAAMDEGAEPAWADRFNPDELSAVQHAMNLKLKDPIAFAAEYQNEPVADSLEPLVEILTAEEMRNRINGLARNVVPQSAQVVTAFIDIQKPCLYYVVAAWSPDFTGAVIDYGTWPDQKRKYFTLREVTKTLGRAKPGAGLEGAIYNGLDKLVADLYSRTFRREDGSELYLNACLIDANWQTETVREFTRRSRRATLIPVHGRGITAAQRPYSDHKRKKGETIGEEWKTSRIQRQKHILFDSNYWKTFIHERLAVPFGDSGNLTLFGDDPEIHRMLCDQWHAEYRTRLEANTGRVADQYLLKPDKPENHLWDGIVGCAVGGSILGARLKHPSGLSVKRRKPKPTMDGSDPSANADGKSDTTTRTKKRRKKKRVHYF